MSYFMDNEPAPLIREIDAFIARHGISAVTFGRKALRDPHFVGQFRAGRRLWPETEAKVREFMASYPAPSTVAERAA